MKSGELETLVAAVLATPKCRHICEDLIRGIGARELAKRRNLKEAIKATKNALHQVGGAYLSGRVDYAAALEALRRARESADEEAFRQACRQGMRWHASTRERLPILEPFYATTLAGIGPIHSVLDLACGLNPLAIPWMPLAEGAEYYACDIYRDLVDFLNECLPFVPMRGAVEVADVTQSCPARKVDLALVLKSLPCLDQIDRSCSLRLLDGLNADRVLVSFPVHSLGGQSKGMVSHYEARFHELVDERRWTVARFAFAAELAFLIRK
jgi:16S rRNA (guanine(1405)-N(7))-methyltransferase